jgi:AraC-like DNA-binding protein
VSVDPFVIFRLTPLVLEALTVDATEARRLLERCGLPPAAITGRCLAPLSAVNALMDEAAIRTADPLFGLHLATRVPDGTYEAPELIVRTAPTLRAAIEALERFMPLINPIGRFAFEMRGDAFQLHYFAAGDPASLGAQMNEFTVAILLAKLEAAVGRVVPRRVWFAHRRQASERAALARALGVPVELGGRTSGFEVPAKLLGHAMPHHDPVVFEYLVRAAEGTLGALGTASFASLVSDALERGVGLKGATLAVVARHLGVAERSAQRRLESEGRSFRSVLDAVRQRRAVAMLANGVPEARVAVQLGFSYLSSFRRARKRWQR